ncbi:hypothetical protein DL96DRAFT_1716382 [Flagelloscypha sp. PMI_526]|nr:hypothetical protein DL96DRAFT_1716382 [Flagelloscypha sp. PMI_526]
MATTHNELSALPVSSNFGPGLAYQVPLPPSFSPLGYHSLLPWFRQPQLDKSGYTIDSAIKAEEARLEGLKLYQNQDHERLDAEVKVQGHILTRADNEATFSTKSLVLLDLHTQITEGFIRKTNAEADRAEAEVALVKSQQAKIEKEQEKIELEKQLLQAQIALATAQATAIAATAEAAANAPPNETEMKTLLTSLEKLDPCPAGEPWADSPGEGGFRCINGGAHFMSYADARALLAKKQ